MENPAGRLLSSLSGIPCQSSPWQQSQPCQGQRSGAIWLQQRPGGTNSCCSTHCSGGSAQPPPAPQLVSAESKMRDCAQPAGSWGFAPQGLSLGSLHPMGKGLLRHHCPMQAATCTAGAQQQGPGHLPCISFCIVAWVVGKLRHGPSPHPSL